MALTDSLVSHWRLDETSGTRNDSHGTNHLTDTNTVGSAAGILSTAAHFIAANSEDLSVADNASLGLTTAFSVSFWINQTDLVALRAFIGKWTFQTDGEWVIHALGSGDIRVFIATSAADATTGCDMRFNDADMSAGVWYHVAVVFDGGLTGNTNRLKLWVNGTQKTLTVGTGAVPATLLDGGATLYLGRWGGSLTRYYNGDMDEVALWSRALTSAEVASLYNGGAGFNYPFSTAQASPPHAAASVGHGQLGLASGLPIFADIVRLGSD